MTSAPPREYVEDDFLMEGPDAPPEQPAKMFLFRNDKVDWEHWAGLLRSREQLTRDIRDAIAIALETLGSPARERRGRPKLTEREAKRGGRSELTEREAMRKQGRAIIIAKWVRDEKRAVPGSSKDAAIESVVARYQALLALEASKGRKGRKGLFVELSVESIKHLLKGN